ncbi:hypothetical protein GCM10009430_11930 [Aquimarina litoralis]|uniref:Type IV secretion system protein n=1 Tax=Aquimarina litoralis TaxID=584605 RepID=A0ABP3TVG3_9FLAO
MDIFEFLDTINFYIFGGDSNITGVKVFVETLMPYSYALAAVIMIILVSSKVFTYFMNPAGNMDPYILVKPVLILVALVLYQPLVELLLFEPSRLITQITETAALSATGYGNWGLFERAMQRTLIGVLNVATGNADIPSIYDILQVSTLLEMIHFLVQIVALVVVGYLMIRQLLLKAVYFIIGVLVLPLSLVPANFEILKKWFFGFLSVLLWVPILRIFQTIITLISQAPLEGFAQPLYSLVLQIVMIMFILQVPKYANFLVGGSGDGDTNGYLFAAAREMYYSKFARGTSSSRENNRRNGK